ncbi:MAG: UDP-N-acetylmuramate:L-alanyl-gamma-D-glutamyl-meso-diaminopimelate ligase [Bdellovibrionales bacterium]
MNGLKPGSHIHLVGICGTAMASLAGILKTQGFKITGSDQNVYPPMSTQLAQLKIPVANGYKPENLNPRPDLVVIGNVISRGNPEADAVLAQEIPYTSLPKALGEFVIAKRNSFVVAGTHGKTTTTSLLAWVTEKIGLKPGFLIGGIPLNFEYSFRSPAADTFVIEGDEYDTAFFDKVPKFIHYRPRHVILTSVEFDHADIYRDLEHVKSAFRSLLELIPPEGTLVYHAADPNIADLLKFCKAKNQVGYGVASGNYQMSKRESLHGRNQFSVIREGKAVADLALKIFGEHNSLNALSVYAMADVLGWNESTVLQALSDFKGVKRRQELLGEVAGITVIEDFAHHPTAVDLTLRSMKEQFPGRRIIAVFEPRSATSRRSIFQQQYAQAFRSADAIFVARPYDQSKISETDRFSTDKLIQDLQRTGQHAESGSGVDELIDRIKVWAKPKDVILIMSNGGFDGIYQKLMEKLGR